MKIFNKFTGKAADSILKNGIGVIPTDTIYGIVCSALSRKTVERIYSLRKRNTGKPVIVLIGSLSDLKKFGVVLGVTDYKLLAKLWPGPISVILPCESNKFLYLHRGRKTIAFRLPLNAKLRGFINKTGPLIAPSANFEGQPPAKTIKEAQKYFGDNVDFYIDNGRLKSESSTIILVKNGTVHVIRKGAGDGKVKNISATLTPQCGPG
jgi:L-threonylcarbamoyladenylate synthase